MLFVAIVVLLAAFFALALRRTQPTSAAPGERAGAVGVLAVALAVSLLIPGVLAVGGLLDRYAPLPAPALLVVLLVSIGTAWLAFSGVGSRLATGLPLAALVGYQTFRVPVEWLLHRLYLEGVIPVEMTYAGRNFDIVTGLTAGALALYLASGRSARGLVLVWNCLGLALLANIVAVAVLATPVPFRYFVEGPANRLPSTFPYVWLPTFLVQAALLGHLLVFRALARASSRPSDW